MISDPRPIAEQFQLANLGPPVHFGAAHALQHLCKLFPAERFLARDHEDYVLAHEAEGGLNVTPLACIHPLIDQLADRTLITAHLPFFVTGRVQRSLLHVAAAPWSPI